MGKCSRQSTLSVAMNGAALWCGRWWCGSCVGTYIRHKCVPLVCRESSSKMPLPWCQAEGQGGVDEISWNQKAEVTSDGKKRS